MAKKKTKKKKVKRPIKTTPQKPVKAEPAGLAEPGTEPQPSPVKVVPHPTAGAKITEFEEILDRQLAGETSPAKRGPGRPRKETTPEPEFAMDEDIIRQAMKMPFNLWAVSQKLEELKLDDEDAAAIAAPVKLLLDHYLPNMSTIAIAWVSLAVTSYSIMVTRLYLIAEIKKQSSSSSDSVNAQNEGHGSPRSPDPSRPPGRIVEFPPLTETVKV